MRFGDDGCRDVRVRDVNWDTQHMALERWIPCVDTFEILWMENFMSDLVNQDRLLSYSAIVGIASPPSPPRRHLPLVIRTSRIVS